MKTSFFNVTSTRKTIAALLLVGFAAGSVSTAQAGPPGYTFGTAPYTDYKCLSDRQVIKHFKYYGFEKIRILRERGRYVTLRAKTGEDWYFKFKYDRCDHEIDEQWLLDEYGNEAT